MKNGFRKKTTKFLQAACLAVGLTIAGWGSGPAVDNAEAFIEPVANVTGWVNPDHNLNNVYIGFSYYLNTSGTNIEVFWIEDSIGANTTKDFTGSLIGPLLGSIDWDNEIEYVVLGVYDNDNDLVTVGFDQDWVSNALGQPWGTPPNEGGVFGGTFGWNESAIANALEDGDAGVLESFISSYFINYDNRWADNGEISTLVKFSNGAAGGTAQATASPVPIPSAILLFAPGLGGVLLLRRKKKA